MTTISWDLFVSQIRQVYPDAEPQRLAPSPEVCVFDYDWFHETFWPYWCEVRRTINQNLEEQPLQNNINRGICDEITKRMICELSICARRANVDKDVGPGAVEASVKINGIPLNYVPDGLHRTAIVALTKDKGATFDCVFVEPQLKYEMFQVTALIDAANNRVVLVEFWL